MLISIAVGVEYTCVCFITEAIKSAEFVNETVVVADAAKGFHAHTVDSAVHRTRAVHIGETAIIKG